MPITTVTKIEHLIYCTIFLETGNILTVLVMDDDCVPESTITRQKGTHVLECFPILI